jgi:hypothetical protein
MAYKVFTNGSPLPASDLNTYLMNQSVMVFANSTARSAALTAPTEGMVTYLEDTGLVYVYNGSSWVDINDNSAAIPKSTVTTAGDLIVADGNASVTRLGIGANGSIPRVSSGALGYLPIGTTGQVLSVSGGAPAWTTLATGGWTQLASTTLSGSSISFSAISGTYRTLWLKGEAVNVSSNSSYVEIRPNGSTVSLQTNEGNTGSSLTRLGQSFWLNNSNAQGSFSWFVYNYASTTGNKDILFSGRNQQALSFFGGGATNGTVGNYPAITSIDVAVTAGSFSGGTVTLFGGN